MSGFDLAGIDDDVLDDRFRGTLLGGVVGDALGAPFEGHPGPVQEAQLARLDTAAERLRYTDDTAMTFALAESLLMLGRLDEDHLAATFAAHYEREPGRGYGGGTADLLSRVAGGADWRKAAAEQFGGQGSLGNGAAMRVAPVALQAPGDPDRVVELARRSARVTHTHVEATDGAALQAAAVALALASAPARPLDRQAFVSALLHIAGTGALGRQLELTGRLAATGSAREVATRIGTDVTAARAVPAAICAFLRHPDSFPDAVRFAIGLGGDTDTMASMAGAIAGARLGASAIPGRWARRSEGGRHAVALADRFRGRLTIQGAADQ